MNESSKTVTVLNQTVTYTVHCERYNCWFTSYAACEQRRALAMRSKIPFGDHRGQKNFGCSECAGVAAEYKKCRNCGRRLPLKEFPTVKSRVSVFCRDCNDRSKTPAELGMEVQMVKTGTPGVIIRQKDEPDGTRKYLIRFTAKTGGQYSRWMSSVRIRFI